jgi:uncharacterized damage-inducible protein DinB
MAMRDALLPEYDSEMNNTRRVLERVPEDKFGWKPHDKSGTMGWLAAHVASLGQWASITMETEDLDFAPKDGSQQKAPEPPRDRKELLELFEKHSTAGRKAISEASDADLMKPWTLLKGGEKLFTMPKVAVLRGFVMNHMIHHRGQLTVYLRLTGAPVPGLYGPSADEGSF